MLFMPLYLIIFWIKLFSNTIPCSMVEHKNTTTPGLLAMSNSTTTKQKHNMHKKKFAIEYPLLGLSAEKVFSRCWHLTPLSTYLLVSLLTFWSCNVCFLCLWCCLIIFSFVHCLVSGLICFIIIFCFFMQKASKTAQVLQWISSFSLISTIVSSIEKKKKKKKKKN